MKYSELKRIVVSARQVGLQKVPKQGWWFKDFYLPGNQFARVALSNIELLYSKVPLDRRIELDYERYYQAAVENLRKKSL